MKHFIKNNQKRISITLIVILLITNIITFLMYKSLKWDLIFTKAVPDVELVNYLSINSNDLVSGSITGFVLFENPEDQPKDMRQYIKISATNQRNAAGNQVFIYQDIIKMNVLAPRYFDPTFLSVKETSGSVITLTDDDNNLYYLNKNTREVRLVDSGGDKTKLITDDSDFRDFFVDLLK